MALTLQIPEIAPFQWHSPTVVRVGVIFPRYWLYPQSIYATTPHPVRWGHAWYTAWQTGRHLDEKELSTVLTQLPHHIELTRQEPGCISFEVTQTDNLLVWQVDELFVDEESFAAHQSRVAESEWGQTTAKIERRYAIEGFTSS